MTTMWEEGDPSSKLLVLAEAPGKTEARFQRPLVGPAGEVFNECLHAAGLHRRECYILNLFPTVCYRDKTQALIEQNRNIKVWDPKKGLTQDGLELARPAFQKLEASGANVVLTMGNPPLDALTGFHKPIMKWRGSPLWAQTHKRKFIPTVHPAFTLHGSYLSRYLIINDMRKVELERHDSRLDLPKRNIQLQPTIADIGHFIYKCQNEGRIATDLECLNGQVYCFSMAWSPFDIMVVPFVDNIGRPYWDEQDEEWIWRQYGGIMSDEKVMKINQNIVGFDAPFLFRFCNVHTKGPIGDTMIAQHVVYPEFPKGLDFIASIHTREPYWKDDGKIWKKLDWDWATFQRYCGTDAGVALEAWGVLEQEMSEGGFRQAYDMTVEMADALTWMTVDGLAVDKRGLAETNAYLEQEISKKQLLLNEACGRELNVNSSKQCQEYFYGHCGIEPYRNGSGGITTDDKAMSRIVRRATVGSREAKLVQEVRRLVKLKSTYMEVELDGDDRLRCSWNPRGTWTGRLSSSKTILGTGLNLQNLDPEFKSFVVAG